MLVLWCYQTTTQMTRKKLRIEELLPPRLEQLSLPSDEVDWVMGHGRAIHLRRGDFFLRAGSRCSEVGILCEGILTSYYVDRRGERRTSFFFSDRLSSIVLDAISLRTGDRSELYIEATRESLLWSISRDLLREHRRQSPSFNEWFTDRLEAFFIEALRLVRAFQQPNLTDRVIYLYERRPELFGAIPKSHLATLLGMHRNTLQQLIDTLSQHPCPHQPD